MPISKPFRRNCRQFTDGSYSLGGKSKYIRHPQFAIAPEHYIRAFLFIQKDLLNLFDYIEPADPNLICYSYRVHELLMRTCIEVEANFKAILMENGYSRAGDWNMTDYKKVNATHHLSPYAVKFPVWYGNRSIGKPFAAWPSGTLTWYQAYNQAKHDRHNNFQLATFESLVDAVSGLAALLASQFYTDDLSPDVGLLAEGPSDNFETAIGNYFRIEFPNDWSPNEQYDFDWQALAQQPDPFDTIAY